MFLLSLMALILLSVTTQITFSSGPVAYIEPTLSQRRPLLGQCWPTRKCYLVFDITATAVASITDIITNS